MKNKLQQFKKNCPNCGNELNYLNNQTLNRSIRNNSNCRTCSKLGKNHPMHGKPKELHPLYGKYGKDNPNYGKHRTDETRKLMSDIKIKNNAWKGQKHTKENIELFTILNRGENNGMYGKISPMRGKYHSSEFCKKQRLRRIKEIEQNNGQMMPNYNISSIPILEQKAKELGITDLQHAENGGEFYIKELGYFVDGYSKEKNIVIEYYENHHSKKIEKDLQRQNEITNLLKCEFIIIKEL